MEFFQEPTFTAFLALILTFFVAKIVSLAVSNPSTDGDSAVCSVNEGAVVKDFALNRGLRVRSSKGHKRVKFVDDVLVRKIDRYEVSEDLVVSDDVGLLGEVVVEEKRVGEKSEDGVDQENGLSGDSGGRGVEEQRFDVREMCGDDDPSKGSEKDEILIETEGDDDHMDRAFSEKEENLVTSGLKNVIFENRKIEDEFERDDAITDGNEGKGVVDTGDNEGLVTGDMEVEGKVRDESDDDDWEGIERSELEKVFAEAVNYVEYGGKGKEKEDDHLNLSSDVLMQLYGLHKVAVEGPCTEPRPMAIKVSARAKWNSWQKLGSMNQEAAMEQYIRVLSDSIPGWMHDYSADDDIERKLETPDKISVAEHGRKSESSATSVGDSSTGQSSFKKDDLV